jgi:hypothetical protein
MTSIGCTLSALLAFYEGRVTAVLNSARRPRMRTLSQRVVVLCERNSGSPRRLQRFRKRFLFEQTCHGRLYKASSQFIEEFLTLRAFHSFL